jgi:hypothetical protein
VNDWILPTQRISKLNANTLIQQGGGVAANTALNSLTIARSISSNLASAFGDKSRALPQQRRHYAVYSAHSAPADDIGFGTSAAS